MAIELSTLFKREDTVGKMPVSRVIQVIILAFMLTGFIGYFANAKDVTQSHDIYSKISDIEPIVNYTQINEREEYNPITNVTGWTKPIGSNVDIPITETPNKYILNPAVIDYRSSVAHIDYKNGVYSYTNLTGKDDWYQHLTSGWDPLPYSDYDWGAFILRMVNDKHEWQAADPNAKIYSYIDTFGFDRIDFNGWNWWTNIHLQNKDKDYNENDQESPSLPYYLGGYGYGKAGGELAHKYYDVMHCNMVVHMFGYSYNEETNTYSFNNVVKDEYASDPQHYIMLSRIDKADWRNGQIIGVLDPKDETSVTQAGLYGLYSANNGGSPSDVEKFSYDIKLHQSPTGVWIYNQFSQLFYPAVFSKTTAGWSAIYGSEGCRSLVFMDMSNDTPNPENAKWDNWNSVREMSIKNYDDMDYGDAKKTPYLTTYIPYDAKAVYADPLKWITINPDTEFQIKISFNAGQGDTNVVGYKDTGDGQAEIKSPATLTPGQWITLIASPTQSAQDWTFKGWYIDGVGEAVSTEPTLRISVPNKDINFTAYSNSKQNPGVSLDFKWSSTTSEKPGNISGRVITPQQIELIEGQQQLPDGSYIIVNAEQFPGFTFTHWELTDEQGNVETKSSPQQYFRLTSLMSWNEFTLVAVFEKMQDQVDIEILGSSLIPTITDWNTLGSISICYRVGDKEIVEKGEGIHKVPKNAPQYILAQAKNIGVFVDWKSGGQVISTEAKYIIVWPQQISGKLTYTAEFRYQPGVVYWGNNESVTAVTFWAERGLRISAFFTDEKGGDYGSDSVYAQVYWKIPDSYTMYQYYICTIDLTSMKWTCQGVITYTNTQDYTLSEHTYNMECCTTGTTTVVDSTKVLFNKFPKAPIDGDTSNYRSMRFSELKPGEYSSQITPYSKLHTFVLKTIVETNPKGLLWGNPQFYFDYYLPGEFKHEDEAVVIDGVGYLKMQNNVRTLIGGVVKYGDMFTVNNKEFPIKDGMVVIKEVDGKAESYPFKGMSVVWKNLPNEPQTHMYLVFTEAKDKTVDLGYALFEEKGTVVNGRVLTSPTGLVLSGAGNWYFAGSVQDIQTESYTTKQFDVASGLYQMNIQQSVFMFLGISLLGIAAVAYYTRTDVPFFGWVVVGGTATFALSIMGMSL